MAMSYERNVAAFEGTVGVEEAEGLLAWLQKHPKAELNLASCTHLHAAQLQVRMAAGRPITVWPQDELLGTWLKSALGAINHGG